MDDYKTMLDKIYSKISSTSNKSERFEIPKPEIYYESNFTIWKNFYRFQELFRRDESFIIKFFKKELGAPIENKDGRIIIYRKIPQDILEDKIRMFFKFYVLCYECNGVDTVLINRNGRVEIVCEACGASRVIM